MYIYFDTIICDILFLLIWQSKYIHIYSLPEFEIVSQVEKVDISNCMQIKSLPWTLYNLTNLTELTISGCPITIFPPTIQHLKKLEKLILRSLHEIETLPETFGHLCNLKEFILSNCDKFNHFPDSIGNLKQLIIFNVFENDSLSELPVSLGIIHYCHIYYITAIFMNIHL